MADKRTKTPFSQTIASLRLLSNMTQEEVAHQLGLDRSSYSYYERGTSLPNLDTLCRLAAIFGVTTDYLLGREISDEHTISVGDREVPGSIISLNRSMADLPKDERELLLWYRQLEAEQKKELLTDLEHRCLEKP